MAADLEPRKYAALDEAIYCRRVHTQYLGNLADGKNSLDFVLPRPSLFHQPTTSDIASRITKPSAVAGVAHHGRKATTPAHFLFRTSVSQVFDNDDVRSHVQCGYRCESDLESNTDRQYRSRRRYRSRSATSLMDRVKPRQPGGMKELKTVFQPCNCASAKSAESAAGVFVLRLRREERPCDRSAGSACGVRSDSAIRGSISGGH
jgi:hypothetical protein